MRERYIWSYWWLNLTQFSKTIVNIYSFFLSFFFFFLLGSLKDQLTKSGMENTTTTWHKTWKFDSCVLLVSVLKKCLRKVTKDAVRQPSENNLSRLATLGFRHQSSAFQGQGWESFWVMAISWHTMTFVTIWWMNDWLCAKYILLWNITTLWPCILVHQIPEHWN